MLLDEYMMQNLLMRGLDELTRHEVVCETVTFVDSSPGTAFIAHSDDGTFMVTVSKATTPS